VKFVAAAPCRLRGCTNRPAPLAGCLTNRLCLPSLSIGFFSVFLLSIRATFCVPLVCICMCSFSWLFWLSCQYLPSDWLERLLWGWLYFVWRLSPESPGRRARMTFGLVIVSLLYCVFVLSPALHDIYFILLWHDIACLCWKCC